MTSLLAFGAGALFVLYTIGLTRSSFRIRNLWLFPAGLSCLFFLFSLYAVMTEGPLGFWVEHTRNIWGNQIWFDLLLAAAIAWSLIVPRAKALGMHLLLWIAFIVGSGSIGFLAMIARVLYLEQRRGSGGQRDR